MMQMRDTNRRLHEHAVALSEAQRIAQMGSWQWNVESNATTCSEELYHLLNFTQDNCRGVYPGILAFVSEEDRETLNDMVTRALRTKKAFEFDHQIVNAKGTVRWIRERGRVVTDRGGEAVHIIGTAQDVTHEKEIERMNKLMVGRELKMIELKKELELLRSKEQGKK
jgi:PAS domain S-box-containing protein